MNNTLEKYKEKKRFGIYQVGTGILNFQIINMIFSSQDMPHVGVGPHGAIDGNILKKIQKS